MRDIARVTFLVLIAVMVGANIPITTPSSQPALDLGSDDEVAETFVVGEGGEGLVFTSHLATSTDVIGLIDDTGVYDPTVDYNVKFNGLGTGLAPPTLDEYADLVGNVNFVTDVAITPGGELPSAVDHSIRTCFPVPDTQGGQGSCAAWTVSYYTNGYIQAKDNGWDLACNGSNLSQLMSPGWVYNKINYGYDSGSNWYRNMALISSVGNADWETMPYDWRDLYGWGDEDAWRNAPRYRVESTYDLTATKNTMVIKSWLAAGNILPMAFDASMYTHLSDDDIISAVEYNSNAANHANTIVGYNDSITADGEAGAFLIVNSWGKTWSGDGLYWMTYDCLKELYWPVMRVYDKVDYEPTLIGTLNQSTPASKDSKIRMGSSSGIHTERTPLWWAGTRPYPAFMCLDISELEDDVGLADFYLSYGTGTTVGTLSSFQVEWYLDSYDEGNPGMVATSLDVPSTASTTVYASFTGLHINQTSPANGTWHRGNVTINGTAVASISREVLSEDFEGRWLEEWTTEDGITQGGLDTWGSSMYRKDAGNKSAYSAGSDAGIVLFEDFDEGGFLPADWSTSSLGVYTYPWAVKNSGYQGCGGEDYLVATRSDRGASFNNTERLYTNSPANASSFEDLELRFYVDYDYNDGDEYLKVLYADGDTYPNWTVLDTYTSDTFGYQSYDLTSMDGEDAVYLGFEYHGTEDLYATIDDVLLAGSKFAYDPHMKADLYIATGSLSTFDNVTLTYDYWIDSETDVDELHAMFRTSTSSSWQYLSNHSGAGKTWTQVSVTVPSNASHIGFRFQSDGVNESEGAYLDDIALTGYINISSVEVSVDGGPWDPGNAGTDWSYVWNTTGLDDGRHDLVARVNYSGSYDQVTFWLRTDNSPPAVSQVWNETVTTGDITGMHVSADDLNGIEAVSLIYNFNALPEVEQNVTDNDNATWDLEVQVPLDAMDLWYRFHLVDTIGNEMETEKVWVRVIDNDGPSLGTDGTSTGATTGDSFTFDVTGLDNIMVANVSLEHWYGDDEGSALSQDVTGPHLVHTIEVRHLLLPIHYRFTVEDSSENTVTSEVRNVTVVDNDLPVFGEDATPAEVNTGGNVTLSVNVSDNIALDGAWVEYRFGEGAPMNATMELGPDGAWTLNVDVPRTSIDPLHYIFRSRDSSGNWNRSSEVTVTVLDQVRPWFGEDTTPTTATTGDPHEFSVMAFDNIEVARAWVEYWYGEESHIEAEMTNGDGSTWTGDPTVRDTYLPMWYVIHIEDSSGNGNSTLPREVTVVDDDEPNVISDKSPVRTTTGVSYQFSLEVKDNLAVANVTVTYRYDDGDPVVGTMSSSDVDGNGNGTYSLLIDIPGDSTDPLHYTLTVTDGSGNANATVERTVLVLDVTDPTAVAGVDLSTDQHQVVTLSSAGSSDNVGLSYWTWTFNDGEGRVVLDGPGPSHTFHEAGQYTITLTVEDPSGNTATDTIRVTVNDITPPRPDAGEDRTVDQNETVVFDATRSSDNVAVTQWTWTFEYGNLPRELSGQDTRFTFYTPGVYQVTLTVADKAGNEASDTVNLTIRDIVDPVPRTPGNMERRMDEKVRFNGSRSSDNVGIVNWTWTIDLESGDTVELYGPEVDYTFREPGEHWVTLTVADADGNAVVSEPFIVEVPNIQLWIMLIIIVIAGVGATAGLAAYTRWKTRKLDRELAARKVKGFK
jgi:PKD repeat protein